jgi:hypothetical protein
MSGLCHPLSGEFDQYVYGRLRVKSDRGLQACPSFAAGFCGIEEGFINSALDAGLLEDYAPNQKLPLVSIYEVFELLERIGHPSLHKEHVQYVEYSTLRFRKDGTFLISTNVAAEFFGLDETELMDALRSGTVRSCFAEGHATPLVSVHEVLAWIETINESGASR